MSKFELISRIGAKKCKRNLFTILFLLLSILSVQKIYANGGVGYKGVKLNLNGAGSWYNIHGVAWGYGGCGDYSFYNGGSANWSGTNLGTFSTTATLQITGYAVVGWTDNTDYVAGKLDYKVWKQGDAEPGAWTTINVGNYQSPTSGVTQVVCTSGNDRVVGYNNGTVSFQPGVAGTYNFKVKGFGRVQYTGGGGGSFNANDGTELTATFTISASAPSISSTSSSITSNSTQTYKGATITINGSNLGSVNAVKIGGSGGTSCSSVTAVSATQVTAVVPDGSSGGTIWVSDGTNSATSSDSYTNLGFITTATGGWNTAATWLGGSVPTSATTTNVTIAHNVTSTTGDVNVGQLTVNASTTLTITAATSITINTASTNSGTITDNGTLAVSGVTYTNSGTVTIAGTFQLNQGGFVSGTNLSYSSGTLVFNHSSGQYGVSNTHAYWPSSSGPTNVTINDNGNTGIQLQTGASRTISGTLTLNKTLDIQSSGLLTVTGTVQINSGGNFSTNAPVYGSASTLIYNTGGSYGISTEWTGNSTTAGTGVPQNVTIQNATTLTFPTTDRGCAGNFNISSGGATLNATSGDLYVAGNFTNSGTFTHNSRAVFFNGSGPQTINGTLNSTGATNCFPYLLINNGGGVTLNTPVNVTNTLTLTTGVVTTTSTNILHITNTSAAAMSGGSSASYVSGPLRWSVSNSGGGDYKFHLGKSSTYLPFNINNPTGTSPVITAEAFASNAGGTPGSGLTSLSSSEYWLVSSSVALSSATVSAAKTSLGGVNGIGSSASQAGTYSNLGGSVTSTLITSNTVTAASSAVTLSAPTYFVLGVTGYITAQDGDWNSTSTWQGGAVPLAGATVTIDHAVTVNSNVTNAPATVTVNASKSLTFGASGALTATTVTNNGSIVMTLGGTLTIAASGTLINNSTFTRGAGTVNFAGAATVDGTNAITFNNFTINTGAVTLTTVPTIDGTLRINGGYVTAAPRYTTNSTLLYNSNYNRSNEWSANGAGSIGSTVGYPNNVTINSGIFNLLNADAGTSRAMYGTLTIASGATFATGAKLDAVLYIGGAVVNSGTLSIASTVTSSAVVPIVVSVTGNITNNGTLTMNAANARLKCANFTNNTGASATLSSAVGGDLDITGSLVDNATFTSNNRAVFFTGTGVQDVSGTGTFNIDYIVSDKSSGSIRMLTNLLVEGPNGGNAITLTNTTDTLNLNGFTLTLGKASVSSTISGSGFIKGSSSSSLTILGTGALGTVKFDQTTPGTTNVLNNLTINRTSTGTVTLGNALNVAGILTLTDGTFTVGANTLTYSGSSIARTSGTIDASNASAAIAFTNTDPLTLPASVFSGNVNNLTMNGTGGVTLSSATTVAGTLTLSSGILTTTSTNKLTINSSTSGAISGGNSSSYVNGPLDRTLANTISYTYPIGGSSFYRPVTLQSVVASGNPVVRATFASTGATTGDNATIKSTLLSDRNWRLEQISSGNTFTSATLNVTESGMTNGTHVIAKSNNNQAGTYVSAGTPQTVASGAITSPSGQGVGYYAIGEIQTYTVTYDVNTGSGSQTDATAYEYNATVTVKNAGTMTKTGYTFAGWNTAANGSGTARAVSSTFSITSNVTLYAQWTINSYTLTYNGNTNTGGSAPTAVTQNYNTSVAVSDSGTLAKTGYSFAGWNTASNGTGTPYIAAETFTFTSDVTLYAQWTINSYSVTYDPNGATGGTEPSTSSYNYNSTVTVSANSGTLVRTGYTFGGWNTQSNGGGTNYTAGSGTFSMGAANVILYAKWNVNSYTVTYNGNGNTGGTAPSSSGYNYSSSVTVSGANTLVKTGNTFAGWNTAANGSGDSYGSGDNFNMPANNVTLYAQWSTGNYTLNYSGNGNTGGTAPTGGSYPYNSSQTVKANTGSLVKTGYTFSGWNTEADGSGTDYAATGSASFTIPAENTTLYAKWSINQYTVAYDGNGSTSGSAPEVSTNYNYNTLITAASNSGSYAKTGYTFAGWNTAANGSGTTYTAGETFNLGAADVTLYAKWTAINYNVFYDENGGTGSQTDATNYNYGQTVTVKNAGTVTRTGYTFAGWNTAANGSGTGYSANQTFSIGASDVTLYAQWTINTYTISYDNNGGAGSQTDASSPYNYNSTVTVKNAGTMTKTGYTFSGWNTASNGSGTSRAVGATFSIASDVTLYAQWTINTYTVSYNPNGGTGSQSDASSPYNYNSTVTVLDSGTIARTGYTFAGWNTAANGSGTSYNATETFVISSNVTLYAKWTINSYSVIYDGNGATGGTEPTTTNHNYNSTVTVASNSGSLVRTGYNFLGWNTAADGSGTNYPAGTGSFSMGTSNVILYAEWSINSYRVTYNGNGNTDGSAPNQADYDYNTTVTVSGQNTLVKTGNTFAGWNTAANGSGTNYGSGDNFNMPANNVTLYAQWSTGNYTLNYSGNGNTGGTAPTGGSYPYNSSQTVKANTGSLVKTGYTFSGWNTEADGTGTNYAATGSASFTIPAENTTLYAKWTINSYTVTYNANGGTGSQSDLDSPYDYDSIVTVKNAGTVARVGYTFNGWNTAADGSGTSYNPGETFNMGTSNVILYAKWTAINYNVTYDENTGTGSQSDATNYIYNQTVTVKNAGTLVKTGYTFAGWNTAVDGSGTSRAVSSTFSITSDVTLYAQWTINTFTVTYNANGGSGSQTDASSPYNYNTTVTVKNEGTIAKAGSEFAGWNTAADGSGTSRAVNSTFSITSNVILYAQWTTNDYTITFNGNGSDGGSMAVQSITYGASANLTSNSFTRTGYVFTGWATSSGGAVVYANAASYTMSSASNVTLYAKWENISLASFRTKGAANFTSGSGWEYNNGNGWVQAAQPPINTNNITISHPTTIDDDFTVESGKTFTVAAGSLTINPGKTFTIAGTANFGGLPVTLKSTAAGTAAIGQITGTLNGATNVTAERYIGSGRRAWRLLTIPVTGPTIRQAWAGANANPAAPAGETAGSGTLITGHGANYADGTAAAAAGFDWFSGLSNISTSSIRFYENDNWYSATNTPNITVAPNKQGYMLFVRGDRTVTFFGNANTTLRPTGTLKTGQQSVAVSNPYEVVGNPYPSPLDLNAMYLNTGNSGKITRNFWVWDATLGSLGVYRAISWDGSSSYDMAGGPGSALDYLKVQSGQAFFVEKNGSGGNIIIEENDKVASSGYALRPYPAGGLTGAITKINVNLHDGATGGVLLDGVKVRLNDYYDKAADETFDVAKLNAFAENLSILRDNRYLSIESRPIPTSTDTVYLSFWNLGVRSYTLRINTTDWNSKIESAVLIDRLTKKSTPIDVSGATTDYNFSIDNTSMGISSDRFILVLKNAATLPVRFTKVAAQKKVDGIAVNWQTANVIDVKDFDVEKSADGVSFTKVNNVAAINTSGLQDYSILDNQPLIGWNYYRIRSNDLNGSRAFSGVVRVRWVGEPSVRVHPNLITNNKINLTLQDQPGGRYQVALNTLSGQRVYNNYLQHTGGSASYVLDLKRFNGKSSSGEYILIVYSNNEIKQTEKVVIQ